MKIIISPDSFKGSLSAVKASNIINKGIKKVYPDIKTLLLPVGDGGEGTMETLVVSTKGEIRWTNTLNPLGEKIRTPYGILGDGKTCVIEMANTSGLDLLSENELSPMKATSYGTGQLIKKALDENFTSFILAIGGSATNDGGVGMLQALGMNILNSKGSEVGFGGGELGKINEIKLDSFYNRIKDCNFIIASDVDSPFIGFDGASHVFGPQKGASKNEVMLLDENMKHWANMIEKVTNKKIHNLKGSGAGGGIGGAFHAFFPSVMKRGIDVVLEYINFDEELSDADLVITGEGKVDNQTFSGKTPFGVAKAASKRAVPTIIITGAMGDGAEKLNDIGVISITSIINKPMSIKEAMDNASVLLESASEQIIRTYLHPQFYKKK